MITFFVNITEFRSKEGDESSLNPINSENINDILKRHKNHPSVQEISQTFMTSEKFSFKFVTENLVREEIMNLDGSKATPIGEISVDFLKTPLDIHLPFTTNSKNLSIERGRFPENLSLLK